MINGIDMDDASLAQFDKLHLECDGMTRCISTVMQRDGVEHRIRVGSLTVSDVGTIPYHMWIEMPDGQICDLRARMWLGEHAQVPHGLFMPAEHHKYSVQSEPTLAQMRLSPVVFSILASMPMNSFTAFGSTT